MNEIVIGYLPEIIIAILAMFFQVAGVFFKDKSRLIINLVILSLCLMLCAGYLEFTSNDFILFGRYKNEVDASLKIIIIFFAAMNLLLYRDYANISKNSLKIEFVTLLLLSVVGILLSIGARDFIVLFCAFELQALAGYALAAFEQKNIRSTEAGLKYFVLGALMSAIMLLGLSFIYGFSGSLEYYEVAASMNKSVNIGLIVGGVLVIAAILFKLSAAPMHFWVPDVYQGAPLYSVNFMATTQKIGLLIAFINVLQYGFGYHASYALIIKYSAIISMFVGALGAIKQESLKRMMAYSAVLNMGYVLIGVYLYLKGAAEGADQSLGIIASLYFILVYTVSVLGFFACLLALFGANIDNVTFEDLKGVAKQRKALAGTITVFISSVIGMPPFAGFLTKYYLFYIAFIYQEYLIVILALISSVIAAFYYLKVIKYMYFMPAEKEVVLIKTKSGLFLISFLSLIVTLFLFILL